MSDVTPIREDIEIAIGGQVDREAINRAIGARQMDLFYIMGITRLACDAANRLAENVGRNHPYSNEATDVWTALRGVHRLLSRVVDHMEDCETFLAKEDEVRHGDY